MNALILGLSATAAVMAAVFAFMAPPPGAGKELHRRLWRVRRRVRLDKGTQRKLIVGICLGVLAWAVTGVAVLVLIAPAAVLGVPFLLRKPQDASSSGLLDALEGWTRTMAGLVATGAPLERAVERSVESAPGPIAEPVRRLSGRLDAQQPLERSMRLWADEIKDPLADMVTATIIFGARQRTGGVEAALDGLATSMAERVALRRDTDAQAAEPRMTAWIMTLLTLAVALVGVFTPVIREAYATPLGQVLLAFLIGAYISMLIIMRRIISVRTTRRIFAPVAGDS